MSMRHLVFMILAAFPVGAALGMIAALCGVRSRKPKVKSNHEIRRVLGLTALMWISKNLFTLDKFKSKG